MTPIEFLHTEARRYCRDRHLALWHAWDDAREMDANGQQAERLNRRSMVVVAVLTNLEATVPADFASLEEAKERLVILGQSAQDWATGLPVDAESVNREATDEERALFCDHVRSLALLAKTPGRGESIEPMPYRRTLGREESSALWVRLRERWHFRSDYWNLLEEKEGPPFPYLAFRAGDSEHFVGLDSLRALLASKGIRRVWQLYPFEPADPEVETEIDLSLMFVTCDHPEEFWTSDAMDWLICNTLDFKLIFAGEWLVEAVKALWPDWSMYALGCDTLRYQASRQSIGEAG